MGVLRAGQEFDTSSCLSIRGFARTGSSLSIFYCARLGLCPPAFDFLTPGSLILLQAFSCLEASAPAPRPANVGVPMALRSFSWLGFPLPVPKASKAGAFPLLRSRARLASLTPVLGVACPELLLSASEWSHTGAILFPRSFS